jgi:hypothetical protein
MVKSDLNTFITQVDDYQNYLNDLRENNNNEEKVTKGPNKMIFNPEKINFLSFKSNNNTNVVEKKDDNENVDLKKLMKFFKTLRTKSKEQISDLDIEEILNYRIKLMSDDNSNIKSDNIIKNEIVNSCFIDEIFDKKREALKKFMKEDELPKLDEFESNNNYKFLLLYIYF